MPVLRGMTEVGGQALGTSSVPTFAGVTIAPASSSSAIIAIDGFVSGGSRTLRWWSELVTIDTGLFSYTTNTIPQYAIVWAVLIRVTVTIPAPVTIFNVSEEVIGNTFVFSVSGSAGTVAIGNANCPYARFVNNASRIQISTDDVPATNAGRVRVCVVYEDFTGLLS